MRRLAVCGILALFGCSQGPVAEKRYEIVRQSGTSADRCSAAKEVASAYLADKNQQQYERWNLTSRLDCSSAETDAYSQGLQEPENLEALPDNTSP